MTENKFKLLTTPIKSPADRKLYRALQLKNGLNVLLIHDPTAEVDTPDENDDIEPENGEQSEYESGSEGSEEGSDCESGDDDDADGPNKSESGVKNAAAALCVNVGSFHEPHDAPGLAHFLEHMVFMGSKKYPDENKFDSFVSSRNGYDNAYTDAENTVYYFEVKPSAFDEALDIWSRFYIDPLMSKDSVNREIQAVDSEFQLAQANDSNRVCGMLMAKAKTGHPCSKFGWGNILSLKGTKDTKSEAEIPKLYNNLLNFHKQCYSAEIMSLSVQSGHSLDELQEMVVEKFSQVPNRPDFVLPSQTLSEYRNKTDTYSSLYGSHCIEIYPIQDRPKLRISFQLPELVSKWKSDPSTYIEWLIGHEGNGSIHKFLHGKGLITDLEAGVGNYGDDYNSLYGSFGITMNLTDEATKSNDNMNLIFAAIFKYLDMLKNQEGGALKRIWDIQHKIDQISWATKEEKEASDNVENLAGHTMNKYDSVNWLNAEEGSIEYRPDLIQEVLSIMNWENSVKILIDPKFREGENSEAQFPEKDEWFGVKWRTGKTQFEPEKYFDQIPDGTFFYPGDNAFLAEDLEIKVNEVEKCEFPVKVATKQTNANLYFRPDFDFNLPKGHIYLLLRAERFNSQNNAKNQALYKILPTFLVNMACSKLYDANTAGLDYHITAKTEGLLFTVKGVSDPLPKLMAELLSFLDFHCHSEDIEKNTQHFEMAKESLIKKYKTLLLDSKALAQDLRINYLIEGSNLVLDYLQVLENESLTLDDLKDFLVEFLANSEATCLIQGNFTQEKSIEIWLKSILETRGLGTKISKKHDPKNNLPLNCLKLSKPRQSLKVNSFNTRTSDNHYVLKYYQYKMETLKLDCIHEVFCDIISEPCFDELRTKKQLGYIAFASYKNSYGVLGFTIEVKSSVENHKTEYIRECIEDFSNKQLLDIFNNLSEETFDNHRKSIILAKQSKDDSLNDEVKRNVNYLIENDRNLDGSIPFDTHLQKVQVLEKITLDDVKTFALDILKNANILDLIVEGHPVETDETKNGTAEAHRLKLLDYMKTYSFIEDSDVQLKDFNKWDSLWERHSNEYYWKN